MPDGDKAKVEYQWRPREPGTNHQIGGAIRQGTTQPVRGAALFIVAKPTCSQSCRNRSAPFREKGQHIRHNPRPWQKRSDAKGNTTRFTQAAGHSWSGAGTTYSDRS